jgi:hypothetical protein
MRERVRWIPALLVILSLVVFLLYRYLPAKRAATPEAGLKAVSSASKGVATTSNVAPGSAAGDQVPPGQAGRNPVDDGLAFDRPRSSGEPAPRYLPSPAPPLPGRTFEGVVLDARSKAPLVARVWISIPGNRDGTRESSTASDGRFALVVPIASQYGAYAIARGYDPYNIPNLTTNRDSNHLEILLERQLLLRGKIVDAQLKGIPASHVWLNPEVGGKPVGSTLANDEGSFVLFRNLVPGSYLLQAYHPEYEDGSLAVSIPAAEEVVLQLNRSVRIGSISGRVMDTGGLPVNGARIMIGNRINQIADQTVTTGNG